MPLKDEVVLKREFIRKLPDLLGMQTWILDTLNFEVDFYKLLGVEQGAEQKQISKMVRKTLFKYHPDKNNFKSAEEKRIGEETFKVIAAFANLLSDQNSRREYDCWLNVIQSKDIGLAAFPQEVAYLGWNVERFISAVEKKHQYFLSRPDEYDFLQKRISQSDKKSKCLRYMLWHNMLGPDQIRKLNWFIFDAMSSPEFLFWAIENRQMEIRDLESLDKKTLKFLLETGLPIMRAELMTKGELLSSSSNVRSVLVDNQHNLLDGTLKISDVFWGWKEEISLLEARWNALKEDVGSFLGGVSKSDEKQIGARLDEALQALSQTESRLTKLKFGPLDWNMESRKNKLIWEICCQRSGIELWRKKIALRVREEAIFKQNSELTVSWRVLEGNLRSFLGGERSAPGMDEKQLETRLDDMLEQFSQMEDQFNVLEFDLRQLELNFYENNLKAGIEKHRSNAQLAKQKLAFCLQTQDMLKQLSAVEDERALDALCRQWEEFKAGNDSSWFEFADAQKIDSQIQRIQTFRQTLEKLQQLSQEAALRQVLELMKNISEYSDLPMFLRSQLVASRQKIAQYFSEIVHRLVFEKLASFQIQAADLEEKAGEEDFKKRLLVALLADKSVDADLVHQCFQWSPQTQSDEGGIQGMLTALVYADFQVMAKSVNVSVCFERTLIERLSHWVRICVNAVLSVLGLEPRLEQINEDFTARKKEVLNCWQKEKQTFSDLNSKEKAYEHRSVSTGNRMVF